MRYFLLTLPLFAALIYISEARQLDATDVDKATVESTTVDSLTQFTQFHAHIDEYSIELDWDIANDLKGDHFEIEKSYDNITWMNIGNISEAAVTDKHYSFVDDAPFYGMNYYRINSVNAEGTTSATLAEWADFDIENNVNFIFYADVTQDEAIVDFEGKFSDPFTIQVYNQEGEMVLLKAFNGTETAHLSTKDLTEGMYTFHILFPNNIITEIISK